jgi:flagellar protein FliO/FliZ
MSSMLVPAIRMVVSLAIVLALMYVAARLLARTKGIGPARTQRVRRPRSMLSAVTGSASAVSTAAKPKRGRRQARRRPRLEVVARQQLGKTASVAVVRVADRTLLLGITDSAVQLLSEIDAASFDESELPVELAAVPDATPERRVAAAAGTGSSASVLDLLRERTVRRA